MSVICCDDVFSHKPTV